MVIELARNAKNQRGDGIQALVWSIDYAPSTVKALATTGF